MPFCIQLWKSLFGHKENVSSGSCKRSSFQSRLTEINCQKEMQWRCKMSTRRTCKVLTNAPVNKSCSLWHKNRRVALCVSSHATIYNLPSALSKYLPLKQMHIICQRPSHKHIIHLQTLERCPKFPTRSIPQPCHNHRNVAQTQISNWCQIQRWVLSTLIIYSYIHFFINYKTISVFYKILSSHTVLNKLFTARYGVTSQKNLTFYFWIVL